MASVMRFDEWQDSNGNPVASGAGGVFSAPGSILQVVSTTKTDQFATTSATMVDVTGFSATITPSSSSSKILVLCNFVYGVANLFSMRFNLVRDSTTIAQGTGGSTQATLNVYSEDDEARDVAGFNFLDSPATTSAITYKIQMLTTGSTGYINRGFTDGISISTITLMEVAA